VKKIEEFGQNVIRKKKKKKTKMGALHDIHPSGGERRGCPREREGLDWDNATIPWVRCEGVQ